MKAALPPSEAARLQVLRDYAILDTPAEAEFDDFARLAAHLCDAPIALISLVDDERQWFKARVGLGAAETCRDDAFCAHALLRPDVLVVPDARLDPRFRDNPLVTGEPFVRFYAGAPLLSAGGHALGTLCVLDRVPRAPSPAQCAALEALARQTVARLEMRRAFVDLAASERGLRESEARKDAVLRSALDAIITMDGRGRIEEWNPAAAAIFGHSAAHAVGRDLADLIIPAPVREAHRRGLAHFLATGDGPVLGKRIEVAAVRADGTEFPVELAISPIRLEARTLFTATLRDISERRAAEAALRDREERYRLVFENAAHGLYRTTPDGRILLANPALLAMLGYESFEELAACDLEADQGHTDYERAGFKARLEAAGELRGLEARWRRRDGGQITVRENVRLVRGADGATFYEGAVEDVTAHKEAEEALTLAHAALGAAHAELEARVEARTRDLDRLRRQNESLLLAAGEGIYGLDADGLTTFVNPAAARMLGWEPSELIGRSMHALMHHTRADGSPYPHDACPMRTTLTDGLTYHVDDEVFWRHDGTPLPVEYIVTPLREDGRTTGAVITFQDISARREAEEALRRSQVRHERIAANVPGVIFQSLTRPDGTRTFPYVSEGSREVYGLAPEEVMADPRLILDIVHPEDRQAFLASLARSREAFLAAPSDSRQDAFPWQWEGRVLTRGGKEKWVHGTARLERQSDGTILSEGLVTDITAAREAAARIRALNAELTRAYDATIEGWSRALDLRDHETEGHSRRVTEMTVRLARALGVSESALVHVRRGALLHDIGKMGVPDGVLRKPGPLSDDEWAVMRRHPEDARAMLAPIDFLQPALDIPWCHHEKWDGSGYPRGLAGEAIPLAARLFALVDVWDALSSDRPYRRAWPEGRVLDHLRGLSGTHFDPRIVETFLSLAAASAPALSAAPALAPAREARAA